MHELDFEVSNDGVKIRFQVPAYLGGGSIVFHMVRGSTVVIQRFTN